MRGHVEFGWDDKHAAVELKGRRARYEPPMSLIRSGSPGATGSAALQGDGA